MVGKKITFPPNGRERHTLPRRPHDFNFAVPHLFVSPLFMKRTLTLYRSSLRDVFGTPLQTQINRRLILSSTKRLVCIQKLHPKPSSKNG